MEDLYSLLRTQQYSGRGIILGSTPSGKVASAYFIMGRSASSRARRFVRNGDDLTIKYTADRDPEHAELIIYSPIRVLGNRLIVTNGDQTDTIREYGDFRAALATREYEPDEPNWTPRISALLRADGSFSLSILKRVDGRCLR